MERAELEQWKGWEVARLLALVESERRYYQEIVAAIPVGLLVLSFDFSIVFANRAVRRIFDLRTSDSVWSRLDTLMPVLVRDRIQGVFKGYERVDNLMVEDGGRRLRISVLPIRNGDEENQFEALVSIEDLTGAPAAAREAPAPAPPPAEAIAEPPAAAPPAEKAPPAQESSVEPANAEALELLQSLDAIIWAFDIPSMSFLFVTNTAEEVLGFHPDHWLSTPGFWSDRIHPDDRAAILESYRNAIAHGQRHSCEFRSQASGGRIVYVRETARILSDAEGQPKHLIGMTIDVTERRQLEEAHVRAERMDAIGKLTSRLSHDLNNMLMIIKGYGEEVLHNVAKNDPLRDDVKEILTATNRIGALTNELLAVTLRQTAPSETVDLSEVVSALEGTLRQTAGSAIAIDIDIDPGLEAKAGRAQIEQLLTSLVARVRASMLDGGQETGKLAIAIGESRITEALHRDEQFLAPGNYAVISVEDTGGSLAHDAQMALFESFLPVKELPGEIGAVLSRSYTFVRQWGGDILVATAPAGTRISILLPYAGRKQAAAPQDQAMGSPLGMAAAEAPAPGEETMAAPEAAPALETILVVEDEGGIRALVRKILRRQGYTVLEASNGGEATKMWKEHGGRIDLLITDVMMPKMDGRELVDTLKEQYPDTKVLYISGYTEDAAIFTADFPPGTAFLQKPFTLGALLNKVKEFLR